MDIITEFIIKNLLSQLMLVILIIFLFCSAAGQDAMPLVRMLLNATGVVLLGLLQLIGSLIAWTIRLAMNILTLKNPEFATTLRQLLGIKSKSEEKETSRSTRRSS